MYPTDSNFKISLAKFSLKVGGWAPGLDGGGQGIMDKS